VCATAIVLIALGATAPGQSVRSLISDGNSAYQERRYAEAESRYREALEEDQALLPGHFNLGNALERQGKYEEAVRQFDITDAAAPEPVTKAHARYNKGNALFDAGQYREAADAFIESLKLNPDDQDAKFNLSLALKKLQEQQQQQQQDKNKQQQKNDQQQDKNKDQNKDQQQQNQQQQQQEKNKQEQNPERERASSASQKTMSKADAERILEVLRNSEKDIQKKLRARQATRPKTDKDW
jgi:tetratricopeptide (TPR) repeat protein